MTLAQVMTLDGWSGWVTAAAVDQGRLSAAAGRPLHRWHVRWLMGNLDAMVASGQDGYYEADDLGCSFIAAVLRARLRRPHPRAR